jgi:hypothetical protein
MDLGVLLPLGPPFSAANERLIESALDLGYSTLWLQDWPVGVGKPGAVDHGTGHDPLVYASHIGSKYRNNSSLRSIGFAALRLDYRTPAVTARAISSVNAFSRKELLLGMGAGTYDSQVVDKAAQDWLRIRAYLVDQAHPEYFFLPPGFIKPRMYLASSHLLLWRAVDFRAEGWLTYRVDPRRIEPVAKILRQHIPNLAIVLCLFWQADCRDPNRMGTGERNALELGRNRIRQFARFWRQIGVTGLIYSPPITPSLDQLVLLRDAIVESV